MTNGNKRFAITVVNDLANEGFELGATIEDKAQIARYYRLGYNENRPNKPITLADDVIYQVVRHVDVSSYGDNYDDIDNVRDEALEDAQKRADSGENVLTDFTAEVSEAMQSRATSIEQRAVELAEAINADKDVSDYIETLVDSNETVKYGPVLLIAKLVSNSKIAALLDNAPEPNTDASDVKGTNQPDNFDKFKKPVKVDGEDKIRNSSFYKEVTEHLEKAQIAVSMVQKIEDVNKNKVGHDTELAKRGLRERNSLLARYKQRVTNYKNQVINAVKVHKQMLRAQNMTDLVVYYIKEQGTGKLIWSPKPIGVYSKSDPNVGEVFSLQQFMGMNIHEAMEKGGTLASLKATIGREQPDNKETKFPIPRKSDDLLLAINALASARNDGDLNKFMFAHITDANMGEAVTAITIIRDWFENLLSVKVPNSKQKSATK